jgi:Cu/Ag efflux protein CusF
MKKLAILAATLLATSAIAQDKAAPAPKGAETKTVSSRTADVAAEGQVTKITATVEAIDQKTREVTLKGPKGTMTFIAGPEVKNLAQVKKGDEIVIEYAQALAMELKKSSKTAVSRTIREGGKSAAAGQKPGAIAGRQVDFVAKIDAIDMKTSMVTLSGVEHTVEIKAKDPAVLAKFKAGDFIEGSYIEAVAVSVQKPAAAAPAKK